MLLNFEELYIKYKMSVSGIIHIGAHYGEEHHLYKKLNIKNIIYVEPLKKNFEVLKKNITDDSVLLNFALGNENKKIDMFVESANNGQSSSVLEPKVHLLQYPHIIFNEKESVEMRRLDDIDLDLSKINMINIDVQGYELEVFKGAEKTLESIDYIFSEINRDEVYQGCAKINELSEFLSKFGFTLTEQSWDGHTWGDGLFIKTK